MWKGRQDCLAVAQSGVHQPLMSHLEATEISQEFLSRHVSLASRRQSLFKQQDVGGEIVGKSRETTMCNKSS